MIKLLLGLLLLTSVSAQSDVIDATKNDIVRIATDQEGILAPGDRVFALDESGKKKAIIKIEKVKGKKAFGRVMKGKAEKNMTTQMAQGAPKVKKEFTPTKERRKAGDGKPLSVGLMAGLGFDSMSVKLATAAGVPVETLSMKGTGFSAKAMVDYNFTSYLGARLLVGMEQLNSSGTASAAICDGTDECKTDISYITTDFWLRYALIDSDSKFWLGAGFGLLMPGAKSTNTLDSSSIGTTSAIYLGAGADFAIDNDMFLPTQVDYAILPSSEQVTASIIAIRAGVGFRF